MCVCVFVRFCFEGDKINCYKYCFFLDYSVSVEVFSALLPPDKFSSIVISYSFVLGMFLFQN